MTFPCQNNANIKIPVPFMQMEYLVYSSIRQGGKLKRQDKKKSWALLKRGIHV